MNEYLQGNIVSMAVVLSRPVGDEASVPGSVVFKVKHPDGTIETVDESGAGLNWSAEFDTTPVDPGVYAYQCDATDGLQYTGEDFFRVKQRRIP